MTTPTDYNKALKELQALDDEQGIREKEFADRKRKISSKYMDLKWELEHKKDAEIKAVDIKLELYQKAMLKKTQPALNIKEDTEKLYKFYQVSLSIPTLTLEEDFLVVLDDDEYKKISIKIKYNRKPKNCYSLVLSIDSIFRWAFDKDNLSKTITLKDAPTKKELMDWYEKNKNNLKWRGEYAKTILLSEYKSKHVQLEKDYEEAIILFQQQKSWQVAYWKHRKYYYENCYSSGTETSGYKEVLDMLTILKTPDKDLPLLINVESEQGKKELERRLYDSHT